MSLFVTDPTTVPGLEQNELMVSFGYSYYAGAPWIVGHHSGIYIRSYIRCTLTLVIMRI